MARAEGEKRCGAKVRFATSPSEAVRHNVPSKRRCAVFLIRAAWRLSNSAAEGGESGAAGCRAGKGNCNIDDATDGCS
jgi:hypothetical protein